MITLHILEDGDTREQNCENKKPMFLNLGWGHVEKFIYDSIASTEGLK